jgi:hypothetical protein
MLSLRVTSQMTDSDLRPSFLTAICGGLNKFWATSRGDDIRSSMCETLGKSQTDPRGASNHDSRARPKIQSRMPHEISSSEQNDQFFASIVAADTQIEPTVLGPTANIASG